MVIGHRVPLLRQTAWVWIALVAHATGSHQHEHSGDEPDIGTVRLGMYLPDADNLVAYHTGDLQWDGFEIGVVKRVVLQELAHVDVQMVQLNTLENRMDALLNGTVDWVVGEFSVTEERKELVKFVTPYYYSAGAALYAPGGSIDGVQEWKDLAGRGIAVQPGYYAGEELAKKYGIKLVVVDTYEQAAAAIASGGAVALLDDTVVQHENLNLTLVTTPEPTMFAPYGVATRKDDTILAEELHEALMSLMVVCHKAPILAIEKEYMIAKGVPHNEDVAVLVDELANLLEKPGPAVESALYPQS